MQAAEPQAARPDLSSLDRETRINVEVAECKGAAWEEDDTPPWALSWAAKGAGPSCWLLVRNDGVALCWMFSSGNMVWHLPDGENLPNVVRDPAAWGALMVAERIAVGPYDAEWIAGWIHPQEGFLDAMRSGKVVSGEVFGRSAGEAVALAVLAKYGIEVPR